MHFAYNLTVPQKQLCCPYKTLRKPQQNAYRPVYTALLQPRPRNAKQYNNCVNPHNILLKPSLKAKFTKAQKCKRREQLKALKQKATLQGSPSLLKGRFWKLARQDLDWLTSRLAHEDVGVG